MIIAIIRDEGLSMIPEDICSEETNFLDITLNLKMNSYRPYKKENDEIIYVHKHSNHPPAIIKAIPDMINKRLNILSSDEKGFQARKPEYEKALKDAGYGNIKLKYTEHNKDNNETKRKNRSRKIIYYNPPWNSDVATNVGGTFFYLLQKHFPPFSHIYCLFNKKQCENIV